MYLQIAWGKTTVLPLISFRSIIKLIDPDAGPAIYKAAVVLSQPPSTIFTIFTMVAPKADFDAVPVIDFALAKTDRAEYFKQLKFACEDVGFGVSAFYLALTSGCRGLTVA
jgi:hypothetical protein